MDVVQIVSQKENIGKEKETKSRRASIIPQIPALSPADYWLVYILCIVTVLYYLVCVKCIKYQCIIMY
jgi:hypothetical protein